LSVGAPRLASPETIPVGGRPGPLTLPQKCVRLADEIETEVARRDHLPFRERQPEDASYRSYLKPLRDIEEELRVVAHMPVGNLAHLQVAADLGREQAMGMVRALRGLVWAGKNDSEPVVPPARFYIGKGSWYQGIPARDLTAQEYAGLTLAQRDLVDSGEIYSPIKGLASIKARPVVDTSVAADPFANSPHLMWSGAHAVKPGYYGELNVLCTNVGGVAQVMPDSWVTSSVKLTDGTEQSEPIAFTAFDTQGQILPGAFTLRMVFGNRDGKAPRQKAIGVGAPRLGGAPQTNHASVLVSKVLFSCQPVDVGQLLRARRLCMRLSSPIRAKTSATRSCCPPVSVGGTVSAAAQPILGSGATSLRNQTSMRSAPGTESCRLGRTRGGGHDLGHGLARLALTYVPRHPTEIQWSKSSWLQQANSNRPPSETSAAMVASAIGLNYGDTEPLDLGNRPHDWQVRAISG
jgi:hypothetical protein